jgi:hypothetical protein
LIDNAVVDNVLIDNILIDNAALDSMCSPPPCGSWLVIPVDADRLLAVHDALNFFASMRMA